MCRAARSWRAEEMLRRAGAAPVLREEARGRHISCRYGGAILFACVCAWDSLCYAQKDCDMRAMHRFFLAASALGWAWCAGAAVSPGNWLSPACTKASPYTFSGAAGGSFAFPSAAYPEWSIFNASASASERERAYTVSAAGDAEGAGMLRFNDGLAADDAAYLALAVRNADGSEFTLEPPAGKLRKDNLYATVRFELSDTAPDADALKAMYPSYADRSPDASGQLPLATAAKLGICVLQDGYFYVSRVRTGTAGSAGTGTPEDFTFEFCKTKHTYAEVGSGAVVIRIEFQSYVDSAEGAVARAFRIFARNASAAEGSPEGAEICLTEGRGYRWIVTEEKGYAFDFSSLEDGDDCQWFYAIDNAWAATGPANFAADGLDAIRQVAFSATAGGFYDAWMLANRSVDGVELLTTYALGSFKPFVSDTGHLFDLYADWAAAYGVTLSDYLEPLEGTLRLRTASGADITEAAFNAFLLNMDPSETAGKPLALTVTGLVTDPETDSVTLTVRGPEGCALATAKAAQVCVRRAATPEALAAAEPVVYAAPVADAQNNLILVLPRTEAGVGELPFMQVSLVPVSK